MSLNQPSLVASEAQTCRHSGLRRVLERIDQPVLWTSVDCGGLVRVVDLNAAAGAWLGRTTASVQGRPLADIAPPDWLPGWEAQIQRSLRENDAVCWTPPGDSGVELDMSVSNDLRGADRQVFILLRRLPVANGAASPQQAEILRDASLLQAIVEQQPECVKLLEPNGTLVRMNRAGLTMLGMPDVESVNRAGVGEFVHPDDRERFRAFHESVCAGLSGSLRFRMRHRSGAVLHVDSTATPIADGEGGHFLHLAVTRDVTSRVLAETAARLADERWRFAIEGSGDGVWDWDIESSTVVYSRRWAEILGIPVEQMTNSPEQWTHRLHPDEREAVLETVQRHLGGLTPAYATEHRLLGADGEWRWVLGRGLVISRDADGRPLRMIGTNTDIDSIKRDAERIEHLRQRLELAIRGSRFGVWEFDLASNKLIWDEQMYAIYGHTPDTFDSSADAWQVCLHPEYRAMVDARFQDLANGQTVELFEFTIRRACDGAERRIEANGYLQRDANGQPQRMVGMNRDITDQWLARLQLQILGTSLSRLRDMVLIKRSERANQPGRIVYANEAFARSTGYTEADLDALLPSLFRNAQSGFPVTDGLAKSKADAPPLRQEVTALTRDGTEIWIDLDMVPIPDPDGAPSHWVLIGHDISERKAAEREILALNLELEQRVAERTSQLHASNQELQAFTYAVSHDLRAPLRGIDGWSQALFEDCEHLLDDIGRAHLHRIRSEVRRMSDLVSGLLRLSRVVQSDLIITRVDLSTIAESILERLREEHRSRIVHTQVQPGMRVSADAPLMFLALANLLENAWKFTTPRDVAEISLTEQEYPDRVVISVRDNGVGFDMHRSAELFHPFVRLHRESDYSGTGIGLATVDRIMRRHGGEASASAVVGEGAVFQLSFPRTA